MKTMKPRKLVLAGTVVAAVALVGCLGCAAQTQTADTGAAQEPVQQEQPGQETAAPEKVAKKTLAEWVAAYPNEGKPLGAPAARLGTDRMYPSAL